jgi:long-chain acyl-CoA synthetase
MPEVPRVELVADLQALHEDDRVLVEILSADGGPSTEWTARQVVGAARVLAAWLDGRSAEVGRPVRIGLVTDNTVEWVVADLAALFSSAVEIPVPLAFTAEQAASLLAGADVCLTDSAGAARLAQWTKMAEKPVLPADCTTDSVDMAELLRQAESAPEPASPVEPAEDAVVKVIHTSGTTSAPKGVMIRRHGIETLLAALLKRTDGVSFVRYLSIVPLSLLIEQVAGIYMPFLSGGRVVFLPPGSALVGTAADAGPRMTALLRAARPNAMVLPPTMAGLLLALCEMHPEEDVRERHLRLFGHEGPVFLACGGAPVPADVLAKLDAYGITLYEGYGLSENSSVVSWNFPGNLRFGTTGRALDHVEVRCAEDGELLVRSASLFAGYTGTDPSSIAVDAEGWLHTGDLAEIDADGYIRIVGRKKNIVITAGGRNISPEWVEAQYRSLPFVREVVIVADGLDAARGLFVVDDGTDPEDAQLQIKQFGLDRLSDVERPTVIRLMSATDPAYTDWFTVTGRPRRELVRTLLTEEK